MITQSEKNVSTRRTNRKPTPIRIVSAVNATDQLTVTFDQPVQLRGTPQWTTDLPSVVVTSASLTSPTTVVMAFSDDLGTATTVTIPYEDESIRNAFGGYVADTLFNL